MPVCYLLHFDKPLAHAGHYLGYSRWLQRRLEHHRNGTSGVPLMRALAQAGIGFEVVRIWPDGDRTLERKLKGLHAPLLCPKCNPESWQRRGTGKIPAHQRPRRRVRFTQQQLSAMRRGYRDARRGRPPQPRQLYGAYMRGYRRGRAE